MYRNGGLEVMMEGRNVEDINVFRYLEADVSPVRSMKDRITQWTDEISQDELVWKKMLMQD